MSFDPVIFEAEVALKLIPTERLPSLAQDALEAGYDGPHVLRLAILEATDGWGIDQALPLMMEELGCHSISLEEAAMRLAREHARQLLASDEDPLPSMPYFHQLMIAADYPNELIDLGYFDDEDIFYSEDPEEKKVRAREALAELLSPELHQRRLTERREAWEREQERIKSEWPYVLNSPSGRALLRERYIEKTTEMQPLLWIELVIWAFAGCVFNSWRTIIIGFVANMGLILVLPVLGEYLRMKRERRDTLLRRRVPDELI